MRVRDVQIEKKKINHVPIKKAISKISQNPRKKKCQRKITPMITRRARKRRPKHHKGNRRNSDEKVLLPLRIQTLRPCSSR
ncbi:MAG: hypothetical protein Udaeo2_16850 [Candidatus Udaeobacter sp.]|nr:MAG: hypothetical protein Udaeo2_16850 [Candidatus Udaeobacter sp.]